MSVKTLVVQICTHDSAFTTACLEPEGECVTLAPDAMYDLRLAWDHDLGSQVGVVINEEEVQLYSHTYKELWLKGERVWKGWALAETVAEDFQWPNEPTG